MFSVCVTRRTQDKTKHVSVIYDKVKTVITPSLQMKGGTRQQKTLPSNRDNSAGKEKKEKNKDIIRYNH